MVTNKLTFAVFALVVLFPIGTVANSHGRDSYTEPLAKKLFSLSSMAICNSADLPVSRS